MGLTAASMSLPLPCRSVELLTTEVKGLVPSKLKESIGPSPPAFAFGTRKAVNIDAPTTAPKSEHFRNFIMLFSPVNYYCANSSRRTVLSVVFGMTRHFLKYFLQAF